MDERIAANYSGAAGRLRRGVQEANNELAHRLARGLSDLSPVSLEAFRVDVFLAIVISTRFLVSDISPSFLYIDT